jgi:O-antigen/teichoic acid export membrane protein
VTAEAQGRRRAGRQLAGGALVMTIGLGVAGVGTIGMIAIAARALPSEQYAAFAVWWTVATLLANVFGVFEAYLTRLVTTDSARSRDARPVTALLTGRAVVAWLLLTAVLLAFAPLIASELFADTLAAALLLPVFLLLTGGQSIQRGYANGHRNFVATASQLSSDGLLRVGFVAALAALGQASLTAFALGTCAAAACGLLVGSRLAPGWLTWPRLRGPGVATSPIIYLLIGSTGPLLANNGSVPWLASISSVDARTVGAFAAAVTLSRIPTQFVTAIFAPLLSHLGHAVEVGDRSTFQHLRRNAEVGALVAGLLYIVAFGALGPWVLSVYVGPQYQLDTAYLVVLAAASSGMFVAVVQQACLAAVDRWPRIAVSWVIGTVAFLLTLALPITPLWRATLAPLSGVLAALVSLTVLGFRAWELRSPQPEVDPAK